MYLLGEELRLRIGEIAETAARRSQGAMKLEEFIALPYFGQIILRFELEKAAFTLAELDRYESLLYEIVGDEFLVDFMGSVYQKAGVDPATMEARFAEMAVKYAGERVAPSVHSEGIRKDAELLLERAGLDRSEKVWEIQVEDGALLLLTMGREPAAVRDLGGEPRLLVGRIREEDGLGLLQAALYAKRNRVSLARLLLENGL